MAVFKTWFTAYLLNALLFLIPTFAVGTACLVAVFSFLGSLFAIPLLYIFWSFFTHERYPKVYILVWSCIAAVGIAAFGAIITIGSLEHDMTFKVLKDFKEFIYTPMLAGVISVLINHKSIYTYTQGHIQTKKNRY